MDCPPGQKKVAVVERWPLWRGGRCGEVAVSAGSTVTKSLFIGILCKLSICMYSHTNPHINFTCR